MIIIAQTPPVTDPPASEMELWQWGIVVGLALLILLFVISMVRNARRSRTHPPSTAAGRRI